jgi:choline kinase
MGDHLFEAATLSRLLRTRAADDESILATDARAVSPDFAAEATKVRLSGDRIIAIGKKLRRYDALDTGLFVCAPVLFTALGVARAAGDTTLSGGIRELAKRRLMRAVDVGVSTWCDIDTVDDLKAAEAVLVSESESEVA